MDAPDRQLVVFVCQHGAFRSRIAAAYFNAMAPEGWAATSAGATPQGEVSERLVPLMAGTGTEGFVDLDPPRSADGLKAARLIAIDSDVPAAETWSTSQGEPVSDAEVRDRIRENVAELVNRLGREPAL
jgi:arsenate reductase (thioredoxin)